MSISIPRESIHVPEREVRQYANSLVNEPAMVNVARIAAKAIGPLSQDGFNALRTHLAYAYAQGYLKGRATGRARIIVPPQLPTPMDG